MKGFNMTQADSVHSTPPTNTSAGQSRRSILGAIATGAVATLASAIAEPGAAAFPADPIFAAIDAKRAADAAHGAACDALSEAEDRYGVASDEAEEVFERGGAACHTAYEAGWALATTQPTTLAGVLAVLRFANQFEDEGNEWPDTGRIGPDGWHYQLRAAMAAAIEALMARAGKAVQS
jgi:hypothetical protein